MNPGASNPGRILVIRLGAMGDIIHTLPAVASLKKSFFQGSVAWLVASRWMPLLERNPFIDELIPFDRSSLAAMRRCWNCLRERYTGLAFDFQGLLQSALLGRIARPKRFFGFDASVAREPLASRFYTDRIAVRGPHRVQRNVQLAQAAGAREITYEAWIPPGKEEGCLPSGPFILASPFAGWLGKEWPLQKYELLAQRLRREHLELVASVPPERASAIENLKHLRLYTSTLPGLIHATRRAVAIVGVDSGPLHLAAALNKPGVALFGPTDPACTGPFGGSMTVIRADEARTTYKRHRTIHPSMTAITIEAVTEALLQSIANAKARVPADKVRAAALSD